MASTALVQLTNTSSYDYTFCVDISKPVKFVNRLVLPASSTHEVEVESVMPLILFDKGFQNAVAGGTISITFSFTTAAGAASTSLKYLKNILRFLGGATTGYETC